MDLLGGMEGRVVWGRGERRDRRDLDEGEIRWDEMKKVIDNLKVGKAAEVDGLGNELWKFGEREVRDWAWRFCNKVWRGKSGRKYGRRGW